MLKIFLTGDNHIGLKYASHSEAAALIHCRIAAFEQMVQEANRENCDLFVIAGDLFENTYSISKKDVRALLALLSQFRGTVVVLPGNHDYYDGEGKVWQYFEDGMQSYDNIMLLTRYAPYSLTCGEEEVILYPALCTSLHSAPGQNNLGWIREENFSENTYHIGIAHGAVEGETIDAEGAYFLMSRSQLEEIPVDLWLIGHTHVPFPRNLTESFAPVQDRIFNAGTHVQTDVSCYTEGQCFILEIAQDKSIRGKKVVSGNLRFYRLTIPVTADAMESHVTQELRPISDNSVVDVILTGAVTAEEYEDRHKIMDRILSRFIEGTYKDNDLNKRISKDLIDSEFSETSFSASLLTALLDEPKEAQLAYELLRSLKEGK